MGAITGVFLMDDLVLRHRPDLCFVEYATSDTAGTTPPELPRSRRRGDRRKLREAGCAPASSISRGRSRPAGGSAVVEAYERVAERHGVPSINVAEWSERRDRSRDGSAPRPCTRPKRRSDLTATSPATRAHPALARGRAHPSPRAAGDTASPARVVGADAETLADRALSRGPLPARLPLPRDRQRRTSSSHDRAVISSGSSSSSGPIRAGSGRGGGRHGRVPRLGRALLVRPPRLGDPHAVLPAAGAELSSVSRDARRSTTRGARRPIDPDERRQEAQARGLMVLP